MSMLQKATADQNNKKCIFHKIYAEPYIFYYGNIFVEIFPNEISITVSERAEHMYTGEEAFSNVETKRFPKPRKITKEYLFACYKDTRKIDYYGPNSPEELDW